MAERSPIEKEYRHYFRLSLICLLLVTFAISHMICWLNPRANFRPTIYFQIPYGWEYNYDSALEIKSAIDFPEGMIQNKIRISRPLKNAAISAVINAVELVHPLPYRIKLAISYLLHHAMNLALAMGVIWGLFFIARRYELPAEGAFLASLWIIANWFRPLGESVTTLFQFAIPALTFLLWIYWRGFANQSRIQRLIIAALISTLCGLTVLIKWVFAPFTAFWLFALLRRDSVMALAGPVFYALPYLLYRWLLATTGVAWYQHEVEAFHQGIWWLAYLNPEHWFMLSLRIVRLFGKGVNEFISYYSVVLAIAALGWLKRDRQDARFRDLHFFIVLTVAMNWLQVLAAFKPAGYMFGDSFLPLAVLFAAGYRHLAIMCGNEDVRWRYILYAIVIMHGIFNVALQIHLPWSPPHEQLLFPAGL